MPEVKKMGRRPGTLSAALTKVLGASASAKEEPGIRVQLARTNAPTCTTHSQKPQVVWDSQEPWHAYADSCSSQVESC